MIQCGQTGIFVANQKLFLKITTLDGHAIQKMNEMLRSCLTVQEAPKLMFYHSKKFIIANDI